MVQDRWSNGVVVSETDEVSGKCLVSTISRGPCPFRCGRNSVVGPGIIGEVSFALRADVLVDTNRHRRVELRPAVTERVVIDQVAILWRGIVGKKGLAHGREPALRDSVPSISRFIHKSGSALYAANRLRGGRIVDFPLEHLQAGTGVDDRSVSNGVGQTRPELRIKIAAKFRGSREGRGRSATVRLTILFPRKEEKRFVLPIVEVRDYDRATEGSTVVVLPVCWRRKTKIVVTPAIGVKSRVAKNLVDFAVIFVRPSLGAKTLDATRGTAELRRKGGGNDFELANRVHGRCSFVEGRSVFGAS